MSTKTSLRFRCSSQIKKSKSLLLGNNNVGMTKQNKLTNSYNIEVKKIRSLSSGIKTS